MNTVAAFVGRLLLALIFIVSGINKLFDIPSIEAMLAGVGLPPGFAVPTALFELLGGLAIAFGVMTRLFAILFAGFSLVTILFFHRQFSDPMQATMALKNVAIAGGFLCLFAHSQMRWSYDSMRLRRRNDAVTREAELRAREAELRAARAEGRAETAPVVATTADGAVVSRRRWWSF
jgi:putative oxidoreductase